MSELVGQNLGQYHITEHIAKGGMATVYLARQQTISRDVAVKVLPRNFTHDDTFIERFNREVEVIAQLQHPHILPVYDFGEHDDMPYIVMAYISGGTLNEQIASGSMSYERTLSITRQMAEALDFAHSRGIIHRDIKPGNVLLDDNGNIYLADFGLAKVTESATDITAGNIIGTPAYMAPEQSGPGDESTRIDVYALGVLVYQMLAGELPYNADNPTQLIVAHLMQPIPSINEANPNLPEELQDVIDNALAKTPSERYATAGELYKALASALGGGGGGMAVQDETVTALMMTNDDGRIIFVDSNCLRILKRSQSDARSIMGKPMHDLLGVPKKTINNLLKDLRKHGSLADIPIEITDARSHKRAVMLSATATTDEKGAFIGADIEFVAIPSSTDSSLNKIPSQTLAFESQEITYVHSYFEAQINALYTLMQNWAGQKVADHMEVVLTELSERNEWGLSFTAGAIKTPDTRLDLDTYRAVLSRAIDYSAHILGNKTVQKELAHTNKQMDALIMQHVRELGIDELYREILGK
ncbi:MAG: protein kinase [Chloroflexota bacterium]